MTCLDFSVISRHNVDSRAPRVQPGRRDGSVLIPAGLEDAFFTAYWIWTPEATAPNASPGECVFRKTVDSPEGKTATTATILITADNLFTLFVNGQPIGATLPDTSWRTARTYHVSLKATANLFAIRVVNLPADGTANGPGPAGLLTAISVSYTDGSRDLFMSDSSWKVVADIPRDYHLASTDDSSWDQAAIIFQFGSGPWERVVSVEGYFPTSFNFK